MTGLYIFAAAAGIPIVVWTLFGGNDDGAEDGGGGEGEGGAGALMLRLLPLSTIALAFATFGVTGLALGLGDASAGTTLLLAVLAALVAGALNSTAFSFLRRTESTSSVSDDRLAGSVGRVIVPVGRDRRGRVIVSLGAQQVQLTAIAAPNRETSAGGSAELEIGAPVLVVEVRNGVAAVARLDPELS